MRRQFQLAYLGRVSLSESDKMTPSELKLMYEFLREAKSIETEDLKNLPH
jgi:hypothetical protein